MVYTKHHNAKMLFLQEGATYLRNKQFYQFAIPAIGAMLVTGLYFVVDGIFVGRGIGTDALAAINVSVPFICILTSVSMMITMGGATITAIHFGRGENEQANHCFQLSLLMVILFGLFMTVMSALFSKNIAKLLGASDILLEPTADYIKYFVIFGIFFCGANTLSAFVRNDNNPQLALWGMLVGALSNIFLDWLFIFPMKMGIIGAAIASGLGQVLACLLLCTHFIRKKAKLHIRVPQISFSMIRQIIKTGVPEFVTQMSQPITILCYNFLVLRMFGEIGVAAFSVVSYLLVVIIGIFIGLAQGMQPLLSRSFGSGKSDDERYFFHKGLRLGLILAIVIYILLWIFGKQLIAIFNPDPDLVQIGYHCLKIYGLCLAFTALNVVHTIYFLSTRRTKEAICLSTLRSFVANTIFVFLIPVLFGDDAIWVGIIFAEGFVCCIALLLRHRNKQIV